MKQPPSESAGHGDPRSGFPKAAGTLDELRSRLDTLDRSILEAAARRTDIVREIADRKANAARSASATPGRADAAPTAGATEPGAPSPPPSQQPPARIPAERPLFDRDREREVYQRARQIAVEVGLAPRTAHSLMLTLVEASHQVQEELSRQRALQIAPGEARRFLIVGGNGRMGRRLGPALAQRGHHIAGIEPDDGQDPALVAHEADIVMIAVPMSVAAEVTAQYGPLIRPDALLCDINSLKKEVCDAMARNCAGQAIGLHPMFGPTVHLLRRQKVVVCPVRPGPRTDWLRAELGAMGMELIEADPQTHDKIMAVVQVLVHFSTLVMGEALRKTGVSIGDSLRFTSPIYRLELAFVGRLFAQNPELYAEIEMTNPHGPEVRRCFLEAANELNDVVEHGDRDVFNSMFREVGKYFTGFSDEAMQLSDIIIDTLVAQP